MEKLIVYRIEAPSVLGSLDYHMPKLCLHHRTLDQVFLHKDNTLEPV